MAKDTWSAQFQLTADFATIQALRRALADEGRQQQLVSRLSETLTGYLTGQIEGDFALETRLKVSAVAAVRRGAQLPTPRVAQGLLTWYDPYAHRTNTVGRVGSAAWLAWLQVAEHTSFRYEGEAGSFTAIKEKRRGRPVWYAHRRRNGRLHRLYLGQTEQLTGSKLAQAARRLNQKVAQGLTDQ